MARTRVWDENEPEGALEANKIDNSARSLKIDIREIVNQLIGVAEATALADPAIATAKTLETIYAAVVGQSGSIALIKTIPWFHGQRLINSVEAGTITRTRNKYTITGVSATGGLEIPVVLPVGVVLTRVRALISYNNAAHIANMNFYEMSAGADVTATAIATPAINAAPQWAQSAVIAITTVVDRYYGFTIGLDNANTGTATELSVHAVQVQYTSASAAQR